MRPKVFVTREIPKEARDLIEKECDLEISPHKRVIRKEELLEEVKDKDGILVQVTDPVDKEVIEAGNRLKIIVNWGEGYNHIDLKSASGRGIYVTNTPSDGIAGAVAESTTGLLLAITKQILSGDKAVRDGKFKGWEPLGWWGEDFVGKTFGILGLGRIGKKMAKRLQGWEMNLQYYDQIRDIKFEESLKVKYVSFETLLKESDFISLHLPLTKETRHLIGEKELKLMKKTAYLINTARGAIIDENALVTALKEKWIAGAGLDVYENEPELACGLKELENVVLTPHLAGASWRARVPSAIMAAKNLLAGVKGEVPPNLVNSDRV